MAQKVKRVISYILVFAMVFSVMPNSITAKAEENDGDGEKQEMLGFVGSESFKDQWDNGVPELVENPIYEKKFWSDTYGKTIYLQTWNHEEGQDYQFTELKIGAEKQLKLYDASNKLCPDKVSQYYDDNGTAIGGVFDIDFDAPGIYKLVYEDDSIAGLNADNNSISIEVEEAEIGFYNSQACTSNELIKSNLFVYSQERSDADKNSFYLKLSDRMEKLREEKPFAVVFSETESYDAPEEVSKYITYSKVSDTDNIYKITVVGDREGSLVAYGIHKDDEENPTRDRWIELQRGSEGLTAYWTDWDETNNCPIKTKDPNARAEKEKDVELDGAGLYFTYVEDGREVNITSEEISKFTVTDSDGKTYPVNAADSPARMEKGQNTNEVIVVSFTRTGKFILNYQKDDNTVSSMHFTADMPYVGFYTSKEMSADSLILGDYTYTPYIGDALYFHMNAKREQNDDGTPCDITGIDIYPEGEGITQGAISVGEPDENGSRTITINKDISGRFELTARVYFMRNGQPDERENRICLDTTDNPEEKPGREWYTDGVAQAGYSGCFLSEYEFKELQHLTMNSMDSVFFVHGESVQEVINKLDAIASGEQKVYLAGGSEEDAECKKEITNTGYVEICVSQFGNRVLPTEYVSSSGYLKGIVYNSTGEVYHTVPDTIDERSTHKLVDSKYIKGEKEYIEDSVYYLSGEALNAFPTLKTALQTAVDNVTYENTTENGITKFVEPNPDMISRYGGDIYSVIQISTYADNDNVNNIENPLTRYYLLGNKLDIDALTLTSEEITLGYFGWSEEEQCDKYIPEAKHTFTLREVLEKSLENPSYIEANGDWTYFLGVNERGYQFPELHVNMNCDMYFIGEYGDRYIGWEEGSPYKARFTSNINRSEAAQEGKGGVQSNGLVQYEEDVFGEDEWRLELVKYEYDASFADKEGQKIEIIPSEYNPDNEKYSCNLNFFKIQSNAVTDAESTYSVDSNKIAIETTPEPNALTELTQNQKDAIEDGGKLEVSIKADLIDETKADAKTKEAIDAIYETIDEQLDGAYDAEFIDINVNATVTKNGQKVGDTTPITDSEGLDIKVPIPEKMLGKDNYKMICAHEDMVIIIKAKLTEDKKAISFRGRKFSVYAIAGTKSGGKETLDLSGAKWDYTSAFTYDGKEHEVKLIGLPEGVTVTYTDNKKTEVGSYEAKASFEYDKTKYAAPDFSKLSSLKWEIKKAAAPPKNSTIVTADKNPVGDFKVTDTGKTDEKGNVTGAKVKFTKPVKSTASVTIPNTVTDVNGIKYLVTEIDKNAFKNDKKLTKIKIGKNVKKIGNYAFSGCKKLTSITLGSKVESIGQNAFANCVKVTKVTITKEVKTIGKGAFSGCKKLKTITIKSKKITKIDKNAFKGVPSNATVKLPKGLNKKQKDKYKKMIKNAGFKGKIK